MHLQGAHTLIVHAEHVCGSSVQAPGREDTRMCTLMGRSHKQATRGQASV
jgi:hypothetical protein